MNARMSIALVRATNRCMRGSRIPVEQCNMSNRFRREGGAGFGLLKSDNEIETFHVKTIFEDSSGVSVSIIYHI